MIRTTADAAPTAFASRRSRAASLGRLFTLQDVAQPPVGRVHQTDQPARSGVRSESRPTAESSAANPSASAGSAMMLHR